MLKNPEYNYNKHEVYTRVTVQFYNYHKYNQECDITFYTAVHLSANSTFRTPICNAEWGESLPTALLRKEP